MEPQPHRWRNAMNRARLAYATALSAMIGWSLLAPQPAQAQLLGSLIVTSLTPASGPVGASVTINGTNFTGASAVLFNGTSASFTVGSATAITATVPAGATSGPISVTTSDGTASSAASFTVINPPTITSFTPSSGPVGTSVTISGTNFNGATAVLFNSTSASFTVGSATAITATVPPHRS